MARINFTDSVIDSIVKLAEGNPGAAVAMGEIIRYQKEQNDPAEGLVEILWLDTMEIYGTDIYVLWSDICGKDSAKAVKIIQATRYRKISMATLKEACSRQDRTGKQLIPQEYL